MHLKKNLQGPDAAFFARHFVAKTSMIMMGIYIFWYHQKYNGGVSEHEVRIGRRKNEYRSTIRQITFGKTHWNIN